MLNSVLRWSSLFQQYGSASGAELWKTDGTVAGSSLVKDIVPELIARYLNSLASWKRDVPARF